MPETAVWTEEMEHYFLIQLLPAYSIPQNTHLPPKNYSNPV